MSKLFIIATPIGNLGDITYRAIERLKSVDYILCEDTRRAKILLDHYEIFDKPRLSFHAQSTPEKIEILLEKISPKNQGGNKKKSEHNQTQEHEKTAAFISDAGTPGISDPGYRLVKSALKKNISVIPLPGPTALVTLLSVSGFPTDKFYFGGFLPHKKGRKTILENLKEASVSHVFYESVHRFLKLLGQLEDILEPERKICVGRELTKKFEDIFRGTVKEAQIYFENSEKIKGEFVVLIAPKKF